MHGLGRGAEASDGMCSGGRLLCDLSIAAAAPAQSMGCTHLMRWGGCPGAVSPVVKIIH